MQRREEAVAETALVQPVWWELPSVRRYGADRQRAKTTARIMGITATSTGDVVFPGSTGDSRMRLKRRIPPYPKPSCGPSDHDRAGRGRKVEAHGAYSAARDRHGERERWRLEDLFAWSQVSRRAMPDLLAEAAVPFRRRDRRVGSWMSACDTARGVERCFSGRDLGNGVHRQHDARAVLRASAHGPKLATGVHAARPTKSTNPGAAREAVALLPPMASRCAELRPD